MPVAELTDEAPVAELSDHPPVAQLTSVAPGTNPNPRPLAGRIADIASKAIGSPSGLGIAGWTSALSHPVSTIAQVPPETMEKPLASFARSSVPKGAGIIPTIGAGASDFVSSLVEGLSTPENIGLLAAGGLGEKATQAVSAKFLGEMAANAPDQAAEVGKKLGEGDKVGATSALLNYAMGSLFPAAAVHPAVASALPKMPLAREEAAKAEAETASESTKAGDIPLVSDEHMANWAADLTQDQRARYDKMTDAERMAVRKRVSQNPSPEHMSDAERQSVFGNDWESEAKGQGRKEPWQMSKEDRGKAQEDAYDILDNKKPGDKQAARDWLAALEHGSFSKAKIIIDSYKAKWAKEAAEAEAEWERHKEQYKNRFGKSKDTDALVKEAIADARKNGKSPEFTAFFGGIDPIIAGTTPEKVAAFAKGLGMEWHPVDAATKSSPTTNPKPIDTELVVPSTIPESPATLQAQSALALDKTNPRAVVYMPEAKTAPKVEGLESMPHPDGGQILFNPQKTSKAQITDQIKAATFHEQMGYVEPKESIKNPTAVVARAADGTELGAAAVSKSKVPEQIDRFKQLFPNAQVAEEKPQTVIGDRLKSPPQSSEAPPVPTQPEPKGNVKVATPQAQALKIGDSITPEHIRQDTWKPIPERWSDNPKVLGKELTKGGRVAGGKISDTQALVALEKGGKVAVVSGYYDPVDGARLRHPDIEKSLRPNRSLADVQKSGWTPIWSMTASAPTKNFLQKFASIEDFEESTGVKEAMQQSRMEESPAGFEDRGAGDPAKTVAATMPPSHEMTPFLNRDETEALYEHFLKQPTIEKAIDALPKAANKDLLKSGILKAIDGLNKSEPGIEPEEAWGRIAKEFYENSKSAKTAEDFSRKILAKYGDEAQKGSGSAAKTRGSEGTTFYANPIIPLIKSLGIKEFAEADLKPLLKNGVNAVRAAGDVIIDTLSPASRAEPLDVDELFKSKGFKEQVMTRVTAVLDHAGTMLDRMPIADQVAFADRVKRGQPQATPELQQVADLIRKWDDYLYRMASRYNPDLPYKENHLRVLWKVVPGSPEAMGASQGGILGKRPWQGSKGFLRKATLADMSEGIAKGGVPVTYNPVDLFLLHAQDVMKFVSANRAWQGLKKTGSVKFVRVGQKPPEGFSRLEDSIAKPYFKTDQGVLGKPGEWWVEDGARRMITNYLSRDLIRNGKFGPAGRAMLAIKNATTALELGLSPFHAVFESNEVMSSSLGLGISKMFHGHFKTGLMDILKAPISPGETYAIGKLGTQFARDPIEFKRVYPESYDWFVKHYPDARQMISDMFSGGGQVKMNEDYRVGGRNGFLRSLREGNYPGAVVRAVPALNNLAMKPLFETYIPRLKLGMFLREYSFELDRNSDAIASGKMTRPELARKTWSFIEDRFGELNWDNLYWDRTFKTGMQLAFRSVTWKLGNLRGFGKAARDLWSEVLARMIAMEKPKMTLPMAWLAGLSAVTAIQSSIISKVSTGKYPWELATSGLDHLRNLIFPRTSKDDPTQRVSIPTYFRDGYRLAESLPKDYGISYVRGGMSGEISRLLEDWQNKDFMDRPIYDPNDSMDVRVKDKLEHLIPMPFGISSYQKAKAQGVGGGRVALGALGYTQAPSSVQPTAQAKVRDMVLKWMHNSGDPKLVAEAKKMATDQEPPGPYSDFRRALRGGDPDEAAKQFKVLRDTHTDKQIYKAMKEWANHPLSESKDNEQKFISSLDDRGQEVYWQAVGEKQKLYQQFLDFSFSQP